MTTLQRNISERLVCLRRIIHGNIDEDSYSKSGAIGSVATRENNIYIYIYIERERERERETERET